MALPLAVFSEFLPEERLVGRHQGREVVLAWRAGIAFQVDPMEPKTLRDLYSLRSSACAQKDVDLAAIGVEVGGEEDCSHLAVREPGPTVHPLLRHGSIVPGGAWGFRSEARSARGVRGRRRHDRDSHEKRKNARQHHVHDVVEAGVHAPRAHREHGVRGKPDQAACPKQAWPEVKAMLHGIRHVPARQATLLSSVTGGSVPRETRQPQGLSEASGGASRTTLRSVEAVRLAWAGRPHPSGQNPRVAASDSQSLNGVSGAVGMKTCPAVNSA